MVIYIFQNIILCAWMIICTGSLINTAHIAHHTHYVITYQISNVIINTSKKLNLIHSKVSFIDYFTFSLYFWNLPILYLLNHKRIHLSISFTFHKIKPLISYYLHMLKRRWSERDIQFLRRKFHVSLLWHVLWITKVANWTTVEYLI